MTPKYIFCFSKDRPESNHFTYCNFSNRNGDYIKNVFIEPVGKGYEGHNFVFPEWLPNYFIKHFSKPCDLIYDCFGGAGTTGLMAFLNGRKCILSENKIEYCELSKKRLSEHILPQGLFA
jgi:DNA modification methylase